MHKALWVGLAALFLTPTSCVRAMDPSGSGAPGGDAHASGDRTGGGDANRDRPGGGDSGRSEAGGDRGEAGGGCPPGALLCDGFEQPLPGAWSLNLRG